MTEEELTTLVENCYWAPEGTMGLLDGQISKITDQMSKTLETDFTSLRSLLQQVLAELQGIHEILKNLPAK